MKLTVLGQEIEEFTGFRNRPCYRFRAGEGEFLLCVALGRGFFSVAYANCACLLAMDDDTYECSAECKLLGAPVMEIHSTPDKISLGLESSLQNQEAYLQLSPLEISILAHDLVAGAVARYALPHLKLSHG